MHLNVEWFESSKTKLMYLTFWLYRALDMNQIAACSTCLKSVLWNTSGPTVFDY